MQLCTIKLLDGNNCHAERSEGSERSLAPLIWFDKLTMSGEESLPLALSLRKGGQAKFDLAPTRGSKAFSNGLQGRRHRWGAAHT